MKPERIVRENGYAQAQTAHLSKVRRGTVVENTVSGTIAEIMMPIDRNKARVKVSYRDVYQSRMRYAIWRAKHVRIIPPDSGRRIPI